MLSYTIKRIVHLIPVAIGVTIFCFILLHIAPGDPLAAIMPADATAEQQAQMRAIYGFDRPLPVQYVLWVWRAVHGDLGLSIATGRPVTGEISQAAVNSFILAGRRDADRLHAGREPGLFGRRLPRHLDRPAHLRHRDAGGERAALLAGPRARHHLRGRSGLAAGHRRRPRRLGRTGAGLGLSALSHSARHHHGRDPDGHHRPDDPLAGGRHPFPGLHPGAGGKGADDAAACFCTWRATPPPPRSR